MKNVIIVFMLCVSLMAVAGTVTVAPIVKTQIPLVKKVNILTGVKRSHFGGCNGQVCPSDFPRGGCRTEGSTCFCYCGKNLPLVVKPTIKD